MKKNCYSVTVKFGHVGRNKFIIKTIPVKAEDGREAANIARWSGRVKHHAKDAIIDVIKINEEQYQALKKEKELDPFFSCSCIQDQREKCNGIEEEIHYIDDGIDFEKRKEKRKEKINFKKRRNKVIFNDCSYMMKNYELSMNY